MNKTILVILLVATSFGLGFGLNQIISTQNERGGNLKRVTGIGGIFFKCKDLRKMREWYKTHLGLNTNQYGTVFEWRQATDSTQKGYTQWSPFSNTTTYFGSPAQDFMINYRVADLTALLAELAREGVTIADTLETYSYGKFVHIIDLEGNKVELWEPNDIEFEKLGIDIGSETTK